MNRAVFRFITHSPPCIRTLRVGGQLTNTGPAPSIPRSLPPALSQRQTSRGPANSASRRAGRPINPSSRPNASPSKPPSRSNVTQIIIDASDNESSEDEPPLLAAPSLSGNGGDIFHGPHRSGNGGDIFHSPHRPGNDGDIFHGPPRPTPAEAPTPTRFSKADLERYLPYIRFRNPQGTCERDIEQPLEGDAGDGDGWYYVTVGKSVGVYNTW